jgi:excinuclease ABC subunit A
VVEHDLRVIAECDWIIDMGPGGGASGGRIVATGTPQELTGDVRSRTAYYLRRRGTERDLA